MNRDLPTISGKLAGQLAADIGQVCFRAIESGMTTDQALSVALGIVADLIRMNFGDKALESASDLVRDRVNFPMPDGTGLEIRRPHQHSGGRA